MIRAVALAASAALLAPVPQPHAGPPARGLSAVPAVARSYDTILDADFAALPARLAETCGAAPPEVCGMLEALGLWWQIAVEPESRLHDVAFSRVVDRSIAENEAWTTREPLRAEAWFYLGAAYGARAQWRVLRQERLAAARDGKRIKTALERSLHLDPTLQDANFGLGLYRYYAGVAPAMLRFLRWLLLLPGGDREGGLRQIVAARDHGRLVRGEADYQLHLIYLWYEEQFSDAFTIVKSLQVRYPRNPLFHQIEAEILDVYFHDARASLAASSRLLDLADARRVHDADLASVRARLNMAVQLDRLGERPRAIDLLQAIVAERPSRPYGAAARAQSLLATLTPRARR